VELADVDIYDPDNYVAGVPHEMFTTLRRDAPVYRHPHPDGSFFWAVTRHEDIVTVNRDAKSFSSSKGGVLFDNHSEEELVGQRLMMLNMDPPDHTRLRKIVNKAFTPRTIRMLVDTLRERAQRIVAEVSERGECDFVTDIACELPLQAIADIMGVPQEDRHLVFDWSNRLIGFNDPEFRDQTNPAEEAGAAAAELYAYSEALAAEKRKAPADDIVTTLLTAEVDGERLGPMEFNMFFLLLAVAGNETTRNAISQSMLTLVEHPDERQRLLDDSSKIDTATEEFLRWTTPVMHFRRTATTDLELHGQKIAEGDRVVMIHMSGNRDEDVFDDPFKFDIARDPNAHLQQIAFGGGGPHFCLGANLARAEIKLMFEELLPVLPDIELSAPPSRLRSNFINGIKHMPISYTPVRAPAPA
jgi:cholest-4-en-3-one 26-monooxygenase